MRRRDLLTLLWGATAVSHLAGASRAAEKVWHIGFLDGGPEAVRRGSFEVFRRGMAERGYVEGKNVVYDARYAEGRFDRLPQLARELIALSPDALLVATTPAATVVKTATSTLPIVIVAVADPVGTGLVRSLPKPGGTQRGLPTSPPNSRANGSKSSKRLSQRQPGSRC